MQIETVSPVKKPTPRPEKGGETCEGNRLLKKG